MTSKEKANELIEKYFGKIATNNQYFSFEISKDKNSITYKKAIQCALICVDEMIASQRLCFTPIQGYYEQSENYKFLLGVKTEIENHENKMK